MSDYLQPEFYRFNEDSLKLVRFIMKELKNAEKILDLGAGCGVIGIELANHFQSSDLHLVELQEAFRESLTANLKNQLNRKTHHQVYLSSFSSWIPEIKYDLIVSNPPYYLPGRGMLGPSEERNRTRSFQVDNWEILVSKAANALAEMGIIYFVVKNDPKIRTEIEKAGEGLWARFSEVDDLLIVSLTRLNEE